MAQNGRRGTTLHLTNACIGLRGSVNTQNLLRANERQTLADILGICLGPRMATRNLSSTAVSSTTFSLFIPAWTLNSEASLAAASSADCVRPHLLHRQAVASWSRGGDGGCAGSGEVEGEEGGTGSRNPEQEGQQTAEQ